MRSLRTFTVLTSLSVVWVSAAYGGAGIINTVVTPLQENTTYSSSGGSKPLTTYVAYMVEVGNDGGNTVNNIRLIAKTTLPNGNGEKAVFSAAQGATCAPTTGGDGTEVQCTIGQLTAGQDAPPIVLFFAAPVKGTPTTPDTVVLTGRTLYAEGTGGINSPPDNSIKDWDPVTPVTLGTDNPTLVKTAVRPGIVQEAFTGTGLANPTDVYATSVKFDPLSTFAVLKIEETPFPATDAKCIGGGHFKTCYQTLLNAPQVQYLPGAGFLTEIIRVHGDNFVQGAKMNTVLWEYTPTDADGNAAGATVPVGLCASPTTPTIDGTPCQIGDPVCLKKNAGNYCEWTFINRRNGFQRGY